METMVDDILIAQMMENGKDFDPSALYDIGLLFGKSSYDLWTEYRESRQFTVIHEALLGVSGRYGRLETCLESLAIGGTLASTIDAEDSRGRSALAWAVEYAWAEAIDTLVKFGANVHQQRRSLKGQSPLLHLAIAGPSPRPGSQLWRVIRSLIQAGSDPDATDHELWTPSHVAASWSLYDVLLELACLGGSAVNWEAITESGQSVLDLAICGGADLKVIDLLSNPLNHVRFPEAETSRYVDVPLFDDRSDMR